MERDQNAGGSQDSGDISYEDRGADNMEDMTRYDENLMDRAAQAGASGAFGANQGGTQATREDAAAAFGGEVEGGSGGGSTDA